MDITPTQNRTYVKDVVSNDDIVYGKLNLLVADVGTGKSTYALEKACNLVSHLQRMAYLIDSVAGREKIVNHPNAVDYSSNWEFQAQNGILSFEEDKIVALTYAKFGAVERRCPKAFQDIQLVVCDEMDNMFWSISADRERLKKTNPCLTPEQIEERMLKQSFAYIALNALQRFWQSGKCRVLAMTATPSKIIKLFEDEIHYLPLSSELVGYATKERTSYRSISYALSHLEKGTQALVYISSVKKIKAEMEPLIQRGLNVGAVWSLANTNHPMTDEQKALRAFIIEKQRLPDGLDMLFFNKSLERCIDIYGDVGEIYIHSRDADTIVQARGRFRGDLDRLYVLGDCDEELIIPAEFLDKPLFTEDKNALAKTLNIRTAGNRLSKFPTIEKQLLEEENYTVEDLPKKQDRHSSIIRAR